MENDDVTDVRKSRNLPHPENAGSAKRMPCPIDAVIDEKPKFLGARVGVGLPPFLQEKPAPMLVLEHPAAIRERVLKEQWNHVFERFQNEYLSIMCLSPSIIEAQEPLSVKVIPMIVKPTDKKCTICKRRHPSVKKTDVYETEICYLCENYRRVQMSSAVIRRKPQAPSPKPPKVQKLQNVA